MENTLLNYMNRRLGESKIPIPKSKSVQGPVITISREVGCGGIKLGNLMLEELNKCVLCKQWQVISKEVLNASANELKIKPEKIDRLFASHEHFTFDEVLSAFSDKYYKSNRTIVKTVREVIRNFAIDGCCIIVGRAGHLIASDVKNALHIRLVAPLEWRIQSISARKNLNHSDALKYIQNTEKERELFREHFKTNKKEDEHFDLTIDVSAFDEESLAKLILSAFELKGIPEQLKRAVPYFG